MVSGNARVAVLAPVGAPAVLNAPVRLTLGRDPGASEQHDVIVCVAVRCKVAYESIGYRCVQGQEQQQQKQLRLQPRRTYWVY